MLAAYRLLSTIVRRVPLPSGVFRDSRAGRREAADRWRAWGEAAPAAGPVVWAHGASIGELQVLEPVLARLARARPDLRFVLSHTSPSVVHTAVPAPVCHRDFLPWDRPADVATALDAVRPALVLCARSDLWPEFVAAATDRGVPTAVAGATVRAGSRRLTRAARAVLRSMHERIAWIGAATAEDAGRWERLGVPPARITVTGDPRHDRILERVADLTIAQAVRTWAAGGQVLAAGSLEPTDDAAVVPALARLHAAFPDLRTVIVPHDPDRRRLEALEGQLGAGGLPSIRWPDGHSARPPAGKRLVLVTTRGALADIYLAAEVAYVGGGFRAGGLHALAEPAAVGLPVVLGPRWRGAADADRMVAAGGAIPVASAEALADAVGRLLGDPVLRDRAGLRARSVLAEGAASATAAAVVRLLGG